MGGLCIATERKFARSTKVDPNQTSTPFTEPTQESNSSSSYYFFFFFFFALLWAHFKKKIPICFSVVSCLSSFSLLFFLFFLLLSSKKILHSSFFSFVLAFFFLFISLFHILHSTFPFFSLFFFLFQPLVPLFSSFLTSEASSFPTFILYYDPLWAAIIW